MADDPLNEEKNAQDTGVLPDGAAPRRDLIDPSPKARWAHLFRIGLLVALFFLMIAVIVQSMDRPAIQLVLPVTGGDLAPNQPELGSTASIPGAAYRGTAEDHLTVCMSSFHEFFILEEMAAHHPEIFDSATWRKDVSRAVTVFHDDCVALGHLPSAPRAYNELERQLKLAAAEVSPLVDGFNTAMDKKQLTAFSRAMEHLDRFIEFTHNAESILSGLDEKREI